MGAAQTGIGLYEEYFRAVRDGARQAAAASAGPRWAHDDSWWLSHEASIRARLVGGLGLDDNDTHPRPGTVHVAAVLAATVLWLDAADVPDDQDPPAWVHTLDPAALVDNDPDGRTIAGLTLRRSGTTQEPQMIARWLVARGEATYATAGHLARHISTSHHLIGWLGPAWWRVFGHDALAAVASDPDASPAGVGRPTSDSNGSRERKAAVVHGLAAAGLLTGPDAIITKAALAARLGISRPTLYSWLPG